MRIVLIGVFVVLFLIVLISGIKNRRVSFLSLFVLALPIAGFAWFEYTWQESIEKIQTNVVQAITKDKNSTFSCQRLSEGFVDAWVADKTIDVGDNGVKLKHTDCANLISYLNSEPKPSTIDIPTLEAMQRLSAETLKIAEPELTSANAECLGIVNLPVVVHGLGGSASQGEYIRLLYKQELQYDNTELRGKVC